jgi:hypothetical protein
MMRLVLLLAFICPPFGVQSEDTTEDIIEFPTVYGVGKRQILEQSGALTPSAYHDLNTRYYRHCESAHLPSDATAQFCRYYPVRKDGITQLAPCQLVRPLECAHEPD